MEKLISVIIPVYNIEPYLPKCLESLVNQTYKNLQIILVDDGSTDGSPKICDDYQKKDKRIQVIHKENGGLSSARNVGLRAAQGDFIGFMDSDDYIAEDMYEYLMNGIEKYDADISICQRIMVENNQITPCDRKKDEVYNTKTAIKKLLNEDIMNAVWNKLYKREIVEGIEFPEGRNYESTAVTFQYIARAKRVANLKESKYYYLLRQGSIVHEKNIKNRSDWCLSHIDRYNELMKTTPEFRYHVLNDFYYVVIKLADAISKFSGDYYLYKDRIDFISNFVKENRDAIIKGAHLKKAGIRRIDLIIEGTLESFDECHRMNLRVRPERISHDDGFIKRNLVLLGSFFKFVFTGIKRRAVPLFVKLKAVGRRVLRVISPTYNMVCSMNRRLKKIEKVTAGLKKDSSNEKLEMMLLMMNKGENESLDDIKAKLAMSIPKAEGTLRFMQTGNLYLLNTLKQVCEENDIKFWICGGTLLGAARHKGFIPWDDDIDIGIMREDSEKLKKVLKKNDKLKLDYIYKSKTCKRILKLTFKAPSPFWVDIMVYDYSSAVNTGDVEAMNAIREIKDQMTAELEKLQGKLTRPYNGEPLTIVSDRKMVDKVFDKYLKKLPEVYKKNSVYRAIDSLHQNWQIIFAKDLIFPFNQIEFEGIMFPCPNKYEQMLRIQYGDYLDLPDSFAPPHMKEYESLLEAGRTLLIENGILDEGDM